MKKGRTRPKGSAREVTIICKRCGNVEIINEGSLCDDWNLCRDCARQDIESGRLKVSHYG